MKQIRILFIWALLLISSEVLAQENVLPNQMVPEEFSKIPAYNQNREINGIVLPPSSSVRTMAEWEEIQSLVITWTSYPNILSQIVDAAQEECEVIIVCSDSNSVKSTLTSKGVPLYNVSYIVDSYNSIWVRDYGQNTVYKNDVDSLYLVDWIYNRPRPADDNVPAAVANFKNIPLYETSTAPYSLVHTGGNFMSDGFGTAFSSKLVLEENGPSGLFNPETLTEAQIDARMNQFMGIDRYIKMETLPYDGIHHIDMHMKLLDEETLLVSEYPTGVADGPQIEINLDYVLNNFNSMYGTPYEVIRIPAPPSTSGAHPDNGGYYRTYTNQVFVNKTIIVPTYRAEYDTIALRILGDAMPGYKIVGIDCDTGPDNIIQASGAIHCITKAVGAENPLLISHQRLRDTYDNTNPYSVEAYINHVSGVANATVFWTTDTLNGYSAVPMTNSGGNNWVADIPAQPSYSTIFYYIHAEAVSGKEQVRPIVAPNGYWTFHVLSGVGIHEQELANLVMEDIFPNPSSTVACISILAENNVNGRITVVDLLGREVQVVHNGALTYGHNKFIIQSEFLPQGVYLVQLQVGERKYFKKFVVQ